MESFGINKQSDSSYAPTTFSKLPDKSQWQYFTRSVHLLTPKTISTGRMIWKGVETDRKQRNKGEAVEAQGYLEKVKQGNYRTESAGLLSIAC